MTQDDIRRAALAFRGTEEQPHFDRASFRVKGKIFATLPPDSTLVVLKLPAQIKESLTQSHPEAIVPLPGSWNRGGWTQIALAGMEDRLMADLIRLAWAQVVPRAFQG